MFEIDSVHRSPPSSQSEEFSPPALVPWEVQQFKNLVQSLVQGLGPVLKPQQLLERADPESCLFSHCDRLRALTQDSCPLILQVA